MNPNIVILRQQQAVYPAKGQQFRPAKKYPETPFEECSKEPNEVYDMVREAFHRMGYDALHYGTAQWNPLGKFLKGKPSNPVILIKPNLVRHENRNPDGGLDCLITHPSVTSAVIDFVVIALQHHGGGTILVGDAPIQSCDFAELVKRSGYDELMDFYRSKGIEIPLLDFRNVKKKLQNGILVSQEPDTERDDGIVVDLGEDSSFYGMEEQHLQNLRVTCYDPRILQKHHTKTRHEYKIANEVIQCDFFINLCKPKSHRKAGATIALKNIVGACSSKEYLPHHALLSKAEGGDAREYANHWLEAADDMLDLMNALSKEENPALAGIARKLYEKYVRYGELTGNELYSEGSWYGNDTIWRTVHDLNRILFHVDKEGRLQEKQQRSYLALADMIVSGHREGPLAPSPLHAGVIALGEDPFAFDCAIATLMGFEPEKLPFLVHHGKVSAHYGFSLGKPPIIISNVEAWNGKTRIEKSDSLCFEPTAGWEDVLGSPEKERWIEYASTHHAQIYIWGFCPKGFKMVEFFQKQGVQVSGILDNDKRKWGKSFAGVICQQPKRTEYKSLCILAIPQKYRQIVKKQAEDMGFYVCASEYGGDDQA